MIRFDSARKNYLNIVLCPTLLLLSACTTELNAIRTSPSNKPPVAGAPYSLSFTQYEIKVDRRIKDCVDKDKKPKLQIAIVATITEKQLPDPYRDYVIDLESLNSFFKSTEATVEYYDNGTLKSLNASADDKTAETLASVFSSVGKVVAAAAAAGGPAASACKEETATDVSEVKAAEQSIKNLSEEVESLTAEVKRRTETGAALGKAWVEVERKGLATRIKELRTKEETLATRKKEIKEKLKKISVATETVTWPADGETLRTDKPIIAAIPKEIYDKWARLSDDGEKTIDNDTAIWLQIKASGGAGRTAGSCPDNKCTDDSQKGFKYRVPAYGALLVCNAATCDDAKDEVVERKEGLISQLGYVYSLPLKSGPFSKKTALATFSESGQPTKLGLTSDSSADKVAGSLEQLVTQYTQVKQTKSQSKLNEIKAETELLTAQKELIDAKKALEPVAVEDKTKATSAFTIDTTLAEAELANIKARAALDEAKKLVP